MYESVLFFILLLFAVIFVHDYLNKRSRVWRFLCQFPGEPAWPLVGNAPQLGTTSLVVQRNMRRLWEKHGMKNFRLMLGTEPMLMICQAEDAKKILSSVTEIEKSETQIRTFKEYFGDSLVQSSGEKWRTMRKLLTPLFHTKALEKYLQVANSDAHVLMDKLRAHAGGPSFDIYPYLLAYGLDVICGTVLGIKLNAQNGKEQEYVKANQRILSFVIKRFYSAWYRHDFIYKMSPLSRRSAENFQAVTNALDRIIDFRRQEFEKHVVPKLESEEDMLEYISKNRNHFTFIDIMLLTKMPDGSPMTQASIREETNLMIFAGFDTTLTTLCWTLYNLSKHPGLQQRAYEEQIAILGEDLSREPTFQELGEMKYLQRFIKESLRHFPTVSQFGRRVKNDIELEGGRVIAAGTDVTFYIPGLHRNPDYFPEPDVFNPDRFLQPVSQYLFAPFSAGPRMCIGMNYAWMEMRAALSPILRRFVLSHAGGSDEPVPVNEVILSSRNGFRLQLKERKLMKAC